MDSSGFLSLGRWWGVHVRMHWAAPLMIWVFGRFQFVPGYWVGIVLLILLHEAGHAVFARRFGQHVLGVELNILGGQCRSEGEVTPLQRALIGSGGVVVQAIVGLVTLAVMQLFGPPRTAGLRQSLRSDVVTAG